MRINCLSLFVGLLFFSLSNLNYPVFSQTKKKLQKIVLDAGHGGRDPGALAYKLSKNEKDLNLDIVLQLGKRIKDSLIGVEVIYTRTTDVFPTLKERHIIANNAGGDLFISVHVNATAGRRERINTGKYTYRGKGKNRRKVPVYRTIVHRGTNVKGTETYVLGLHRNSQKERAIGEYGETITEEPGLLDENDPMTKIIIAQYSQSFLERSVSFGSKVQGNFSAQGRNDMGVKQKGLEVLAGSAMPGVLIEIGFINNEEEEIYMNSQEGQKEIVDAIFQAIKSYKAELEKV